FSAYFLRFKKHDLFQMSKSLSGANKLRAFSNAILLQNYFVFKTFMGCVHIYDAFFANKNGKKLYQ
ncbi:MAG: hypothetical protein NWP87_02415, partial [Winogradskyella sp.]|nr:hypothetical protein [Winogradskyella sp.]